jgi:hypothetical protein
MFSHFTFFKKFCKVFLKKIKRKRIFFKTSFLFGHVLFLIQLFFNVTNIDRLSEINFVL